MHIMPQNNPTENQGNKIPVSKLRRDNHLAVSKMQEIRKTI
jgi:hypothetical protein